MISHCEYLLSYGNAGDFGRFRSERAIACRRGGRVVVRSHRGQELAVVMRHATKQHASLLADKFVGHILRLATEGDLHLAEQMRRRSQALFGDARRFAAELELPLEILDAEMLLDGRQAVLHYLRWAECDPRQLMDRLAQAYHVLVTLHDLALARPQAEPEETEHAGCGRPDCGSGSGGCGSCSSGGCSTCGSHQEAPAIPADARPMIPLASS